MKNTHSDLILVRDYTRRESLQLLGLGAATTLVAPAWAKSSTEICTLAPELTVGPYYVDKERIRSNITENKPGIPMLLRITVLDAMTCKPVKNAAVDIWHCDAAGYYSGYTASDPDTGFSAGGPGNGPGGPGGPGGPRGERPNGPPPGDREGGLNGGPGGDQFQSPTDELTFFRGVQFSNAKGVVEFTTIYPGWYFGRATHIHLKVHSGSKAEKDIISGGHVCHIGQLAFPDELSDQLANLPPFKGRKLVRVRNDEDSVFSTETAAQCMVKLTPRSSRDLTMGFVGETALTVDTAITPKPAPMRGGPQQRPIVG